MQKPPEKNEADQVLFSSSLDVEGRMKDFRKRADFEKRRFYARSPKKVSNIVAQLFAKRGYGRIHSNEKLQAAWVEAVGKLAKFSRAIKVSRGKLEVVVSNSAMIQEFTFQKRKIVKDLESKVPELKIVDLRFKVGKL